MSYEKIDLLVNLFEEYKNQCSITFINGDNHYSKATSGYLEKRETEEIEFNFSSICNDYHFYNNPSTFVGDIVLGRIGINKSFNFLYSAAQIGIDINRRSFIPNFSELNNIFPVTCKSYQLSLLQNKYHYYIISRQFTNVPQTYIYRNSSFDFSMIESKFPTTQWIIKPNLECAARGVSIVNINELKSKVESTFKDFKQDILIQEYIQGVEIEIPVLVSKNNINVLEPIRINKSGDILSEKIIDEENYNFSFLDVQDVLEVKYETSKICEALECEGLCRFDFIRKEDGSYWLFDIAALPLITQHSSCYVAFKKLYPNNPENLYKAIIGAKLSWLI